MIKLYTYKFFYFIINLETILLQLLNENKLCVPYLNYNKHYYNAKINMIASKKAKLFGIQYIILYHCFFFIINTHSNK